MSRLIVLLTALLIWSTLRAEEGEYVFVPPEFGLTLPLTSEIPSAEDDPDEIDYTIWGRAGLSFSGNCETDYFYGLALSPMLENYTRCHLYGLHLGWDSALTEVKGAHLALFCYARESAWGQFSLLAQTRRLDGIQAAVGGNVAEDVDGLQSAVAANSGNWVNGVQLAGFFNGALRLNGLQAALANSAGDITRIMPSFDRFFEGTLSHDDTMNGVQLGVIGNFSDTLNGVQLGGLVNTALRIKGMQSALINLAEDSSAVQLGLFNSCSSGGVQVGLLNRQTGSGWQFGLINYAPGGWLPLLPFVNCAR